MIQKPVVVQKNELKNEPGVYFIINKLNNRVMYVGQSAKVKTRVNNHFEPDYQIYKIRQDVAKRKYWLTPAVRNRIKMYQYFKKYMDDLYLAVAYCDISELNENEKYYIEKYTPAYNWEGIKSEYKGYQRKIDQE